MTEKMVLPFVFHALGYDADREQISIVECGGKSNLPLFVEICRRARVPSSWSTTATCARAASRWQAELKLNELIRRRAGARRTVVLDPDFEGVSGFRSRPTSRSEPGGVWRDAHPDELPEALVRAVTLALARSPPPAVV